MSTTAPVIPRTPLLELLVQASVLTRTGQAYVLAIQRRLRKQGKKDRVGDIVRSFGLAESDLIEKAALTQETMDQPGQGTRFRFLQRARRPLEAPLTMWLLAVVAFATAHFWYGVPAPSAAGVCGFLATAGSVLAQYRIHRRWWPSFRRVVKVGLPLVILCIVVSVVFQAIGALHGVEEVHTLNRDELTRLLATLQVPGEEVQVADMARLQSWVGDLVLALGILTALLILGLVHVAWKYRVQRFWESRSTVLEMLMFRTRECMADTNKTLSERQRIALKMILESVRSWMRLNAWDSLRATIPVIWPKPLETVVYYFAPESQTVGHVAARHNEQGRSAIHATTAGERRQEVGQEAVRGEPRWKAGESAAPSAAVGPQIHTKSNDEPFAPVAWACNPQARDEIKKMHRYLADNHRPRRWKEAAFRERVRMAKGDNPRGWRTRYLRMAHDPNIGSVVGYVFDKHDLLVSDDASDCLAFDGSYWDKLKAHGYTDEDLKWVCVRSFVACPVPGHGDELRGVLFVAKTFTHGFGPEDEEFAVAASQMIATVLSAG